MKILIGKNFKAIRIGAFVVADSTAGEAVLDTEDTKMTNAQLQEVAKANKIETKGAKDKDAILDLIEKGITAMKLPEANEKPDTLVVEEIVEKGMKEGLDDEDMVIQIIEAGIKFKVAAKMFQAAKEKLGYNLSNKDRKDKGFALMKEQKFKPKEFSEVHAMAELLVQKVPDTELNQAMGLIRKYAKEMEIDLPKPEKGKGAPSGFRAKVQAHMLKTPNITEKDFAKFVKDNGKDQKVADRLWKTIEFAQKLAKAMVEAQAEK